MKNLIDFMESCGLPVQNDPILDGTIHRYSSRREKQADKSEWYVGFCDNDFIYCTFGTWRNGTQQFTYRSWETSEVPVDIKERMEAAHSAAVEEVERLRIQAIETAYRILQESSEVTNHPYLERKRVAVEKVRQWNTHLIIPIYDIDDNLISIQKIDANGEKRFLQGAKVSGGMLMLGEPSDRILVAEGYATAKSLRDATGLTVVIGFSAHNLPVVGRMLVNKYPDSSIELCADLGKAGMDCALEWEKLVGTTPHFPHFEPQHASNSDFNDMYVLYGSASIAKILGKTYTSLDHHEFIAQPIPEMEWIVDGLFVKGSVNMIFAGEGMGKSWLLLDLAFCLTTGQRFIRYPVSKQRVLLIDGEMLDSEIMSRLKDTTKRYNRLNEEGDELIYPGEKMLSFLTSQHIDRNDLPEIDLFRSQCRVMLDKLIEKHDVIILDNLWNLTCSGDTGEDTLNYDSSWNKISLWLRRWKKAGKTFIIAHHLNKKEVASGTRRISSDMLTIVSLEKPETINPELLGFKFVVSKGRHIPSKKKIPFELDLDLKKSIFRNGWSGPWQTKRA